jgi:Trk-type K+ transport system membrane component
VSSLTSGTLVNTVTVSPPAGIPGVASASASAAVSAQQIGVIPTLGVETLILLMLAVAGLAGAMARKRMAR